MSRCIAQLHISLKNLKKKCAVSCHLSGPLKNIFPPSLLGHFVFSLYNFICLLSDLSVDGCIPVWSEPTCDPRWEMYQPPAGGTNAAWIFTSSPRVDNVLSQHKNLMDISHLNTPRKSNQDELRVKRHLIQIFHLLAVN